MGNEASPAAKLAVRVLLEGLIWLPVGLILTLSYDVMGELGTFVGAVLIFIAGCLLYKLLTPVRSRISFVVLSVVLIAVGILQFKHDLPTIVWMGVLLWRGRYPNLTARHYGLAFLICCISVIVASQNDLLPIYRILFTGLALVWVISWFISLNRGLLDDAGLRQSIVTRQVRLAGRKYLFIFLAAALFIFALTASYGKQLLTPPALSSSDQQWVDLSKLQHPPEQSAREAPILPPGKPSKPSVFWEIMQWVLGAVAAVGLIWFIRMLWKDRTWTLRGLLRAIREWFFKEKKADRLPYVEEIRSLSKDKKKGPSRWDRLFHRADRGRDWEQLNNPEKVRRIYEEAVTTGIEQGFDFQAHHTPSETLNRLEGWRSNQKPASSNTKEASYWKWLMNIKATLLPLYEKSKYSPHSVSEQEVGSLTEDNPERKTNL